MLTGSTAAAGLGGDCTGEGPLWEPEAAGFSAEAWVGAGPLWEADEAGFWGEARRRKVEGWGREGPRWEAEAASRWAGAWDREGPLREPGAARAWAAGRVEVSGSRGRPSRRRFLWLCVSSGASGAACPEPWSCPGRLPVVLLMRDLLGPTDLGPVEGWAGAPGTAEVPDLAGRPLPSVLLAGRLAALAGMLLVAEGGQPSGGLACWPGAAARSEDVRWWLHALCWLLAAEAAGLGCDTCPAVLADGGGLAADWLCKSAWGCESLAAAPLLRALGSCCWAGLAAVSLSAACSAGTCEGAGSSLCPALAPALGLLCCAAPWSCPQLPPGLLSCWSPAVCCAVEGRLGVGILQHVGGLASLCLVRANAHCLQAK